MTRTPFNKTQSSRLAGTAGGTAGSRWGPAHPEAPVAELAGPCVCSEAFSLHCLGPPSSGAKETGSSSPSRHELCDMKAEEALSPLTQADLPHRSELQDLVPRSR